MADRLPLGGIKPAARPVGAFITPAQIEAQAPAKPTRLMASNGGISLQATAAKPNVAGYNPGEQLGEALQNFGANLTKTLSGGLQLYASHEYQAGQNEVAKASMLAERQMVQSEGDYAAANRELFRADPFAAMAMDQTNPFRAAGRQRALSQLAAAELPIQMDRAYREQADQLVLMDPTDQRINSVKAQAVTETLKKFSIDDGAAGFMEFVVPSLNRSWEKITAQQIQDRNKYLKDTIPRTAAANLLGIYVDSQRNGVAAPGPNGGVQMLRPGMPGFDQALAVRMTSSLDEITRSAGLPGETQAFKEQAIERLRVMGMSGGETDGIGVSGLGAVIDQIGISVGGNQSVSAGLMFQQEKIDAEIKYGEHFYRQQERAESNLLEQYQGEIAARTIGLPDGPDKARIIAEIDQDERFAGLSVLKRLEAQQKGTSLSEDITTRRFDPTAMADFMADVEGRYGDAWDPKQAEADFREALKGVAPENREKAIEAWSKLRERKNKDAKDYPENLINPPIEAAIKANLAANYPNKASQASLRGANVTEMMAWGDANVAESTRRQHLQLNKVVRAALAAREAKEGRKLSEAEIIETAGQAIDAFQKNNKSSEFQAMFPGAGTTPSVGGAPGRAPERPKPPAGRVEQNAPVYPASGLDNIPNRQQRLQDWRSTAVMDKSSALREVQAVLNGKSLSASVVRAAKDAGVDPATFVLTQLQAYPGAFDAVPKEARDQFVRQIRNREGLKTSLSKPPQTTAQRVASSANGRNAQGQSYLEIAGNWLANAVMPAAQARSFNPATDYMPGVPRVGTGGPIGAFGMVLGMIRSGEGGWESANRGVAGDTPGGIPGLSKKTLGQWKELQARGFNALGAYQFIPSTLKLAAREAGISDSTVMTPDVQDRLAVQLMIGSKRPKLAAYLKGQSNDVAAAADDLALEWASIATRGGGTAYPDRGGNRASITRQAAVSALQRTRQQYLATSSAAPMAGGWQPARSVSLSSRFGSRESFRTHSHEGVDLPISQGTPLAFRQGGQVIQVQRTGSTSREAGGGYGTFIDIRLDSGQVVRMAHLSQVPRGIEAGTRIKPGQSIALSGGRSGTPGAGRSTGDHLHLEELSGPMGIQETTRGKLDPARRGGVLDHLLLRR